MPPVWKPQPIEVYQSWIDAINDEASDNLSHWETDFIFSIGEQLRGGRILSQAQADKLESIYAKYTS